MRKALFIFPLFLFGCPTLPVPTPNAPVMDPFVSDCDVMCTHLMSLGCDEGMPLYDSTVPGISNVPNLSCTKFCAQSEAQGVSMSTSCVSKVTSCDEIETARANCQE